MALLAGRLLMLFALGHLALALFGSRATWQAIVADVLWNSVPPPWIAELPERQLAFWTAVGGFAVPLFLLGRTVCWASRRGMRLPPALPWGLLAYGICAGVMMPLSPFWLLIAPATLLLADARRDTRQHRS